MSGPDDTAVGRILDAAAALLGNENAEFSMAEVAERAGLSRGTVYRRFPSRQALIDRLVAERGVDREKLVDTRERILDAVATLIGERGLTFTTMELVAERAGVGTMTIYRHFGDREGLLRAFAAERTPRRLVARLDLDDSDDMERTLSEFVSSGVAFLAGNPELIRMEFAPNEESATLMASMRAGSRSSSAALLDYLTRQVNAGRLHGEPARLRNALMGMVFGMSHFERDECLRDPHGVARFIVHVFINGCSPERGKRGKAGKAKAGKAKAGKAKAGKAKAGKAKAGKTKTVRKSSRTASPRKSTQ